MAARCGGWAACQAQEQDHKELNVLQAGTDLQHLHPDSVHETSAAATPTSVQHQHPQPQPPPTCMLPSMFLTILMGDISMPLLLLQPLRKAGSSSFMSISNSSSLSASALASTPAGAERHGCSSGPGQGSRARSGAHARAAWLIAAQERGHGRSRYTGTHLYQYSTPPCSAAHQHTSTTPHSSRPATGARTRAPLLIKLYMYTTPPCSPATDNSTARPWPTHPRRPPHQTLGTP